MASFVVMERRAAGGETDVEFVRDGFHLLAFLVPFFWFLFHRMWIEAAAVLVLVSCFAVLTSWAGYPAHWPLSLLVSIFAGLEAPALRLAAMRRAGWRDAGLVEADDYFAAETRYAAGTSGEEHNTPEAEWAGEVGTRELRADTPHAPRKAPGPALGLFSYPDGR
jgi:hypothetical protein